MFLVWKHGFVRHDMHAYYFFMTSLFILFLVPANFPRYNWRAPLRVLALGTAMLLCAAGTQLVDMHFNNRTFAYACNPWRLIVADYAAVQYSIQILRTAPQLQHVLDKQEDALAAELAFPVSKSIVGNATIDVLSWDQTMLLVNRFNWRPRPVLQSYAAYTPFLVATNAQFFRGSDAPEYVFYRPEAMENWLPSLEDSQALIEIVKRYEPVSMEKGFLLLKRMPAAPARSPDRHPPPRRQEIYLNEEVPIEDPGAAPQELKLEIKPSKLGRARHLLYKPSQVFIRLRMSDGETLEYKLIPAIARTGFLINPLILSPYDVLNMYSSAPPSRRVVSFSVCPDPEAGRCYRSAIQMTLTTMPGLPARRLRPEEIPSIQYACWFHPIPREIRSYIPPIPTAVLGKDVLVVHAEGSITIPVPAGAERLKAVFGIAPGAYEVGRTDGVQFAVEYLPEHGSRQVLFQRYLDPLAEVRDRGFQSLDVPIPPHASGTVVLRTYNLPGKHDGWDWSFWADVDLR
jgi:hypothetical protein